jgi:hypothetical protein
MHRIQQLTSCAHHTLQAIDASFEVKVKSSAVIVVPTPVTLHSALAHITPTPVAPTPVRSAPVRPTTVASTPAMPTRVMAAPVLVSPLQHGAVVVQPHASTQFQAAVPSHAHALTQLQAAVPSHATEWISHIQPLTASSPTSALWSAQRKASEGSPLKSTTAKTSIGTPSGDSAQWNVSEASAVKSTPRGSSTAPSSGEWNVSEASEVKSTSKGDSSAASCTFVLC